MAYRPLPVDMSRWPYVARFVHGPLEQLYFTEARTLLRLPQTEVGLTAGCEFAAGSVLLAAVGGIAHAMYRTGAGHEDSFRMVLAKQYPWDGEATGPAHALRTSSALLAEYCGAPDPRMSAWPAAPADGVAGARKVRFRRLETADGSGLDEQLLEVLEVARDWPLEIMPSTLEIESEVMTVNLERLYWGIREMVRRMVAQPTLMDAAERQLGKDAAQR